MTRADRVNVFCLDINNTDFARFNQPLNLYNDTYLALVLGPVSCLATCCLPSAVFLDCHSLRPVPMMMMTASLLEKGTKYIILTLTDKIK